MEKEDYWILLCSKNPALKDREEVTLKTNGIKSIVFQAFEMGKKEAEKNKDIFSQVFGGKK